MKKPLIRLAGLVTIMSLLVACGDNNDKTPDIVVTPQVP